MSETATPITDALTERLYNSKLNMAEILAAVEEHAEQQERALAAVTAERDAAMRREEDCLAGWSKDLTAHEISANALRVEVERLKAQVEWMSNSRKTLSEWYAERVALRAQLAQAERANGENYRRGNRYLEQLTSLASDLRATGAVEALAVAQDCFDRPACPAESRFDLAKNSVTPARLALTTLLAKLEGKT